MLGGLHRVVVDLSDAAKIVIAVRRRHPVLLGSEWQGQLVPGNQGGTHRSD